jgi:hypothetical protein
MDLDDTGGGEAANGVAPEQQMEDRQAEEPERLADEGTSSCLRRRPCAGAGATKRRTAPAMTRAAMAIAR